MADVYAAKRAAVDNYLRMQEGTSAPMGSSLDPKANVMGIGIGPKLKDGKPVAKESVRVYVQKKFARELVPDSFLIREEFGGLPTDVIESGLFIPAATVGPVMDRIRPAPGGCSLGCTDPRSLRGTLGAYVMSGADTCILSNNHVIAGTNALAIGTDVFQPSPRDGGTASDAIAKLLAFLPIDKNITTNLDCAIAKIINVSDVDRVLLPSVGALSNAVPMQPVLQGTVEKVGRTTGYTEGEVFDVDFTAKVHYGFGFVTFDDQVLVKGNGAGPFAKRGDSGALVVDKQAKRGAGLIFAVSPEFAIVHKLDQVLNRLNVTLVV